MGYINKSYFMNDSFVFFLPIDILNDGYVPEDPLIVKLLVSITLLIFMLVSVMGNVCICAVVALNKSMRTPTNCYLVNLAVTDFLTSLYIPVEIYFFWIPDMFPFGAIGCRVHYIVWDCLSNCSVLTIVAFTVERYLVVTKPFLRDRLAVKSRVIKILAVNWVVSGLMCIPNVMFINFLETKKYVYCYWVMSEVVRVFCVLDVIFLFVVPMTIISVLYVLIALKLRDTHFQRRSSPVYGKQDREKAVKMLAAVAGLFFVCWAPYCIYKSLMIAPEFKNDDYYNLWRVVYYLCCINIYFSTAGNPILYSLMSRKFRRAFKDFLKGSTNSDTRTKTETTLLSVTNVSSVDAVPVPAREPGLDFRY